MHKKRNSSPSANQGPLKVSLGVAMLFLSPFVHRRRETTHPVPTKVFLKVCPDMVMLFSQPVCAQEEMAHSVPTKVF